MWQRVIGRARYQFKPFVLDIGTGSQGVASKNYGRNCTEVAFLSPQKSFLWKKTDDSGNFYVVDSTASVQFLLLLYLRRIGTN